MADEEDLHVYFTKDGGGSQTDPNDSIGGLIASNTIYPTQSTLTTVTTDHVFIDSTATGGGEDHVGSWIVFYTGNNLNDHFEIVAWNDGTGEFTIDTLSAPATVQVGDTYRLFAPNSLFDSINVTQGSHRFVSTFGKSRSVVLSNETAGAFTALPGFRAWIEPISPGPLVMQLAMSGNNTWPGRVAERITTEEGEPNIDEDNDLNIDFAGGGINVGWRPQRWGKPTTWTNATHTPVTPTSGWDVPSLTGTRHLWLSVTFNQDEPLPMAGQAMWKVWFGETAKGENAFMVIIDIDGVTEIVSDLTGYQRLRVGGGAVMQVNVIDALSQDPVPDHTVAITLEPPSTGSLGAQNQTLTTADGTPVRAVYTSSTDPADEGDTVTYNVEVT